MGPRGSGPTRVAGQQSRVDAWDKRESAESLTELRREPGDGIDDCHADPPLPVLSELSDRWQQRVRELHDADDGGRRVQSRDDVQPHLRRGASREVSGPAAGMPAKKAPPRRRVPSRAARGHSAAGKQASKPASPSYLGEFIVEKLQEERQEVLDGRLAPDDRRQANDGGGNSGTHLQVEGRRRGSP